MYVSLAAAPARAELDAAVVEVDAGVGEPDAATEPAPLVEAAPSPVYETVVVGERPYTAASSTTVRDRDFLLRTHPRPADILQVTPGFYVVQHAGGGKANQYFLRGFDADHGTDVALFVDGIPVNNVSHGHGQGYADLNWLIPEVVKRIEVNKGPYHAQYGDFATAGAINLVTREAFDHNFASLGGGSFSTYRAVFATSPRLDGWTPLVIGQVYGTDGPFQQGEDLERYALFAKVTRPIGELSKASLAFMSYGAGWNASGQIPLREVRAGRLDRFGSIDPTEGGSSQRHAVYASFRFRDDDESASLLAYLVSYRLSIFSNFTFFSRDRVNGDMIEQNDFRTMLGIDASYRFTKRACDMTFRTSFGAQMRNDLISNALHYDRERERLETVVSANVREGSIGVYAQNEATWTSWLRSVIGVRADYFGFEVHDRLEDPAVGNRTSGVVDASILSPKANVVVSPAQDIDVYLNFGMGFHSNDARGVVRGVEPVTPLTRATGAEVGARTELFDRIDLAGAAFLLDLDSEIVWVGDEGVTEARGPTRRLGVELETRARILPWLYADFDATVSKATFVENPGNANAVALAPTLTMSAGISARHPRGVFGRVGAFHLGDRPATEDEFFTAEGFTRVDATLGWTTRWFEVTLEIQNVLDTEWREAQFANVSRLPSEVVPSDCPSGTRAVETDGAFAGCEDLHFTPGAPFNAQLSAAFFF